MTGQQLIEYCAKSVNVRCASESRSRGIIASRLFWRHVTRRAQNFQGARDGALCFHQACQAEIGQVWFAFCVEQYVSRFNVAMKDAMLMRVMNGARQFRDELCCPTRRHWFLLDHLI